MYSDQARRSKQSSTRAQGDNETYEDFTPRTDWARNEDHETLLLFLPGFNKDKLRVQLTDHGVLKISGRQPQSDSKGIRFRKDVPVPSSCDTGNVTAKFENGVLFITLQKKPTPPPKKTTPPLTVTEASWPDHPVPDTPGDSAPTNRGVVSGDSPAAPSGGGDGGKESEEPSHGDGGKGLQEREEPSYGDGGKEREEPSYGNGVKEREKPSHGDDHEGSRERVEPSYGDDVDTGSCHKSADGGEAECCGFGGGASVEGEEGRGGRKGEDMGAMVGGVFVRVKKRRRKCIEIVVVAVWGLLLGLLLKRSIGSNSHHHQLQQL